MRFFGHADVIVVGGGTAGIVAAIASARTGTPTLLVEQSSGLGGTSTRGLMNCFVTFHDAGGRQAVRGIAQEIVDRLVQAKGSAGHTADTMGECVTRVLFDPFVLGNVLFEMAGEAGVELLLHTAVADVLMEADRLTGLVLYNKGGLQVATCRVCIDASGDGDVGRTAAHHADVPARRRRHRPVGGLRPRTTAGVRDDARAGGSPRGGARDHEPDVLSAVPGCGAGRRVAPRDIRRAGVAAVRTRGGAPGRGDRQRGAGGRPGRHESTGTDPRGGRGAAPGRGAHGVAAAPRPRVRAMLYLSDRAAARRPGDAAHPWRLRPDRRRRLDGARVR